MTTKGSVLPQELLAIQRRWLFRDSQIGLLASLLNPNLPSPSTIVLYGPTQTGKSGVLRELLGVVGIPFGVVDCAECINVRHLFTQIYSSCVAAVDRDVNWEAANRCDNVNSLAIQLQHIVSKSRKRKLYIVCKSIDRQRETSPNLISALARLGDLIPGLSTLLVVRSARSIRLPSLGVPFVQFPDYSRREVISMVARDLPTVKDVGVEDSMLRKWYAQFVAVVYDALIGPVTRSLLVLREACERLWPVFLLPVSSGEKPPGRSKEWDFSRLLVRNRNILQADGEHVLIDRLEGSEPNKSLRTSRSTTATNLKPSDKVQTPPHPSQEPPLLKYFCTMVLVACFLASHNSPKTDTLVFSRLSSSSRRAKKSYHRRKLLQSPSKAKPNQSSTPSVSVNKTNAVAVLYRNTHRSFTVDRLVAIVRAIHPHGVSRRKGVADQVVAELAELARLRLVAVSGGGGDDEKWMVNVHRGWVEDMAAKWGIEWKDYEV